MHFHHFYLFDFLIKIVPNRFAVVVSLRIRYFLFMIVHGRMQTMFDLNISIDLDFFLYSMRRKFFWVHVIRCELCHWGATLLVMHGFYIYFTYIFICYNIFAHYVFFTLIFIFFVLYIMLYLVDSYNFKNSETTAFSIHLSSLTFHCQMSILFKYDLSLEVVNVEKCAWARKWKIRMAHAYEIVVINKFCDIFQCKMCVVHFSTSICDRFVCLSEALPHSI